MDAPAPPIQTVGTARPPLEQHGEIVTDPRRQRRILIAMCTALIAVIASVSGLNVAQQDLALDLGASQGQLLWVINGYTMALAALLLPIGAIGDRWGRKPILVAGLVLFMAANTAAGFSTSVDMLLISRVMAGVAAAMIMPVTLSVITSSFPAEQRARAVGIWSGFAGAGGILGLFVSSFLIDNFTWPWLFAMPVAFAGDLAADDDPVGRQLPRAQDRSLRHHRLGAVGAGHRRPRPRHPRGPGAGLDRLADDGRLIVGIVAALAFVFWELRLDKPLLEIRLFRNRGLAAGSLTLLIVFAVMFGIFLVLVQFMQAVLGYSAIAAAASLLPMMVVMMPLSGVAPTIAQRVGTRRTLLLGVGLFAVGLVLLATMVSASGGYWSVLPGLLVVALGIGLCMSPSTMTITESLPSDKQGVASALNDTVRELGGAVGIALLGSLVSAGYRSSVSDSTTNLAPGLADRVEEGIGSAFGAANDLGADAPRVLDAARDALVDGWRLSMWFGVALAAGAFLFLVLRGPRPAVEAQEDVLDLIEPELEPA